MRIERKIISWWIVYLVLLLASLQVPHRSFPWIGILNLSLQVLLGLICLHAVGQEKSETKPIFVNFAMFFLFAILVQLSVFSGSVLFAKSPYATMYYHQYVNKLGYTLLLALSVVYVAVDYLARDLKVFQKYMLTAVILLTIFFPLYSPYFEDPLHLYHRPEYMEFTRWNNLYGDVTRKLGREPSDLELMQSFGAGRTGTAEQPSSDRLRGELEKYKPYFGGANATTMFWRPLNFTVLLVNASLVVIIGLVFLFKFVRDFPHAAYVEKILQTFFVLCTLEILHLWSYTQSTAYEIYRSVHEVGQYVTVMILLAMVYVFSMRLRFVLSSVGKYYEGMVSTHPDQVTRWRDEIDNVILRNFFKGKKYLGRIASFQSNHLRDTNRREDQL